MASTDYFLKIDGIEGESQDDKHKGEIDIQSFSWGASNAGSFATGGGGGSSVVQMQDIVFMKDTDKATPKLMTACSSGKHIPEAVLTVRKSGEKQQEYYKMKFKDILVSSVQINGSPGSPLSESLSLNFSKIEIEYAPQKADGSLDAPLFFKWDVKARKEA